MSKTFRKAAMSTICMLIVAVMSLTGATYAWFTSGDTAKVDGMSMQIETAAGGLEVSTNGSSWASSISLGLAAKSTVKPVSTVDAKNFASLASYDPADSSKAKFVDGAGQVITQTLYLGNSGATEIKVDLRNTYVKDIENTANNNTTTKIADAARIAIFTVDAQDNKTLVGIMNPYWDGTTTAPDDAAETYNGVNATTAITATVDADKYVTYGSGEYTTSLTTKTTDGLELTVPAAAADGTRGQLKIEVVVWLEGQDAKCINANAGGAFEIALQFNKTDAQIADLVPTQPANP